jgi:hypothetical protein
VDLADGQLIEGQEKVYKTKNVGTLNCLLEVPREYALSPANCQHFILELICRIHVADEGNAYANQERASRYPQIYCGFLLFGLGFPLNVVFALLLLEPMSCISLCMYHIAISLVMIQDISIRKL